MQRDILISIVWPHGRTVFWFSWANRESSRQSRRKPHWISGRWSSTSADTAACGVPSTIVTQAAGSKIRAAATMTTLRAVQEYNRPRRVARSTGSEHDAVRGRAVDNGLRLLARHGQKDRTIAPDLQSLLLSSIRPRWRRIQNEFARWTVIRARTHRRKSGRGEAGRSGSDLQVNDLPG